MRQYSCLLLLFVCFYAYGISTTQWLEYNTRFKEGNFGGFTKNDLKEMVDSEEEKLMLMASYIYEYEYDDFESVVSVSEYLLNNDYSSYCQTIARRNLINHYIEQNDFERSISIAKAAIQANNSENASLLPQWYQILLSSLYQSEKYDEVATVSKECFAVFAEHVTPGFCYHFLGTVSMISGDFKTMLSNYKDLFSRAINQWDGEQSVSFVPLALDSSQHFNSAKKLQKEFLVGPIVLQVEETGTTQQWPFYVTKEATVKEMQGDNFLAMRRFISEKKALLYKIPDAIIFGHYKTLIKDGSVIVPSFPYSHSKTLPTPYLQNNVHYSTLPVIHIADGMRLHFLDDNYFHFTVESLSKIIIALHDPQFPDDMKFIVKKTTFSSQYLPLLGIEHRCVYYDPAYSYEISNLYLIEWQFDFSLIHENEIHPEDYFVPPVDVLQFHRREMRALVSVPVPQVEEPSVKSLVFLYRPEGTRRFLNFEKVLPVLERVTDAFGVTLSIHGMEPTSILEQITQFSSADVVVGIHGAGLSNILFCGDNTILVELPVYPSKVSVYSRLASAFQFPYYTVPDAVSFHFQSYEVSELALSSLERTLTVVFSSLSSKSG